MSDDAFVCAEALTIGSGWAGIMTLTEPGLVVIETDAGERVVVDPMDKCVGGTSATYYPGEGTRAPGQRQPHLLYRWIGPRLGRQWIVSVLPETEPVREYRTVGKVTAVRTVAVA